MYLNRHYLPGNEAFPTGGLLHRSTPLFTGGSIFVYLHHRSQEWFDYESNLSLSSLGSEQQQQELATMSHKPVKDSENVKRVWWCVSMMRTNYVTSCHFPVPSDRVTAASVARKAENRAHTESGPTGFFETGKPCGFPFNYPQTLPCTSTCT